MRISRLVIESDERNFTLDLHQRCTVISGLSPVENEAMISELTGALGAGRPGVHLELTDSDGIRLAVFRPHTSRHRVVDVEQSADVTDRFRRQDGSVDLLRAAGTNAVETRDHLVLTPGHLPASDNTDPVVRSLARIDQRVLRDSLVRLEETEKELTRITAAAEADADTDALDHVETVHAELEHRQERHERARRFSFYTGVFAAVASFLVVIGGGPVLAALPLLALAGGVGVLSILQWHKLEEAREREDQALDAAGAQSYLGLHIERVNSLLTSGDRRSEMLLADEKHRQAIEDWTRIAGDVPPRWVLEHSYEIAQAAALRRQLIEDGALAVKDGVVDDSGLLFLRSLRSWTAAADGVGDGGGLPIVCNDPFQNLDPAAKPVLLEELNRVTKRHQVIFLTRDPDVISWAEAEAVTGQIALLEQTPKASDAYDADAHGAQHPAAGVGPRDAGAHVPVAARREGDTREGRASAGR